MTGPTAVYWDKLVERDDTTRETTVYCVTGSGHPVALALDEEHAEALAGSLLDTPDGEDVEPAAGADLRDELIARVRALHAPEAHYAYASAYGWSATCEHCDTTLRDASGRLDGAHFEDQYGDLRCRTNPRRTCAHCVTTHGEEAPWPCATATALDNPAEETRTDG